MELVCACSFNAHLNKLILNKVMEGVSLSFLCVCSKYYEKEALMHDSVFGPILAALLGEPV